MIVTRVVGTEVNADGSIEFEVARLDVDRRSLEAPKVLGKKRVITLKGSTPTQVYLSVKQAGDAIQASIVLAPEALAEYINRRLEDANA